MSPCTLRYQPREEGNAELRERLKQRAGQHCRHGYRMLHNRLRADTAGRSPSSAPTGCTARKD
jgi:hypothetical protein